MSAFVEAGRKARIAVLASGEGTNLQAILDACREGRINAEVAVVVANRRHCGALSRARLARVETLIFESDTFPSRTLMCSRMAKALKERNIELVCLAGYMMKLEPCVIRAFPNRILNIHPALLPRFGGQGMFGRHVHAAVMAAGEQESGCTVHMVDEIYDHGPILAQERVGVDPADTPETLANRIHPLEHALYTRVIQDICAGAIDLDAVAGAQKEPTL